MDLYADKGKPRYMPLYPEETNGPQQIEAHLKGIYCSRTIKIYLKVSKDFTTAQHYKKSTRIS